MRPEVGTVAERLYEALGPITLGDEDRGWGALILCAAICDPLLEDLDPIVFGDDEYPGWARALDPNVAPKAFLIWLGQFVGVKVDPQGSAESDEDFLLRAIGQIEDEAGWARGRPARIKARVARTLTGSQVVILTERTGSAYRYQVSTLTDQTPDAALTEKVARSEKPGGLKMTFDTITGGDWDTLVATHADWDEVVTDLSTWDDVVTDPSVT